MRLLLIASLPAFLCAQEHGSISANPYSTAQDSETGGAAFRARCAGCHGLDASGGAQAPSLVSGTFKNGGSDEAMYRTITGGVPGTPMIAFAIPGREAWQIITFLRGLNIVRAAEKATGDPAKGSALFDAHKCGACHTVGTKGGLTGPDLSEIGARRSLAELKLALENPDAVVPSEYWSVRARSRSGETILGIRLNEDMDSVQIRGGNGRLRSFRKADLVNVELIRTSPMPSFRSQLSESELLDLVAYLAGLRKPANFLETTK